MRIDIALKLAVETPDDTLIKFAMAKANEIALNIHRNGESGLGVVLGGLADVGGEALLTIEDTFALATGIRIRAESVVPPFGGEIIEEVMDDAITERGGDDFAGDGIVNDEGNAAARDIDATNDTVTKKADVFHIINFETVFVDGFTLAFAGDFVSAPKFTKQIFFKTARHRLFTFAKIGFGSDTLDGD